MAHGLVLRKVSIAASTAVYVDMRGAFLVFVLVWLHWCVMPRVLEDAGHQRSQGTVLRGWPQSCGARWLPLADEAGEGFGVVDQELEEVEERELER